MEQLEKLMNKLNTDALCSVSIYDKMQDKYVCTNLSHLKILEDYCCAEDYFESIYALGHTNLTVQERRKNGNAIKNIGTSFDVSFGENALEENKLLAFDKKIEKVKKKKVSGLPGTNELIDLKIASIRAVELQRELDELKVKYRKKNKKYKVLEREKLTKEFTVQKSDSFNNMLLGAIKQAPVIMAGLGIGVPVASQGLNSPEIDADYSNFSTSKIDFLELVKTLEDDTIDVLTTIYNKVTLNNDNGAFTEDLVTLFKKHNMITL